MSAFVANIPCSGIPQLILGLSLPILCSPFECMPWNTGHWWAREADRPRSEQRPGLTDHWLKDVLQHPHELLVDLNGQVTQHLPVLSQVKVGEAVLVLARRVVLHKALEPQCKVSDAHGVQCLCCLTSFLSVSLLVFSLPGASIHPTYQCPDNHFQCCVCLFPC